MSITIDTREVDRLLLSLPKEIRGETLGAALLRGGQIVALDSALGAPRGLTGRLAAAEEAELATAEADYAEVHVGTRLGSKVFYQHFVVGGTKPHELRDVGEGVHPGAPPNPFRERALTENQDVVIQEVADEVRRRAEGVKV